MRVRRFASPAQRGAVFVEGTGWKIFGIQSEWNHGAGVGFAGAHGSTLHPSRLFHNGQIGLMAYKSHDLKVNSVEIARNNTDGFWIADWESGGFKVAYSHRATFSNLNVHDNKGVGMWADIDNRNTTFTNNVVTNNAADGIRFEISYGGTIAYNTVSGNGRGLGRIGGGDAYSMMATAGIVVNTSNDVAVHHNVLRGNANGVSLQHRNRGSGTYGTYELRNAKVYANTITMNFGTRYGENVTGLWQNVGSTAYYTSKGNVFYGNTYILDSLTAPRFLWMNKYVSKDTWRSHGQDTGGVFRL